ncbi:DUF6212 domain-containing protein [Kordiimonas sp.]|uniref:DUF6212 domain-containing protein n=1 Tax=Kordiimonas sp. TaxID=1970157 RepID=UPI003A92C417
MPELKLTTAAFKTLYGGGQIIVVDEALYEPLVAVAPTALTLVCATTAGQLYHPGEQPADAHLVMPGMSFSVCAFILTDASKGVYAEWSGMRLLAQASGTVPVLVLEPAGSDTDADMLRFIVGVQNDLLQTATASAAGLEKQVVYLRQSAERMMTSLALTERILDSLKYQDLTPVASLAPGRVDVGPTDQTIFTYSQIIPVDGLGLSAVSVYVSRAAKTEGHLSFVMRRVADNKKLAEASLGYGALAVGWCRACFDGIISDLMGDVVLEVIWHSTKPKAAPKLALAGVKADRFGRQGGNESLALKLYKSICKPDLGAETLRQLDLDTGVNVPLLPGAFPSRTGFYGGPERLANASAEVDFAPYQRSDTDGWLQAYMASDGVCGVTLAMPHDAGPYRYKLDVELIANHGLIANIRAVFVASLDNIEAQVHALSQPETDGVTHPPHTDIIMIGGERRTLTLHGEAPAEGMGYIVVLARSLGTQHTRGWLRLNRVDTHYPITRVAGDKPGKSGATPGAENRRWLVRSMRLPELSGLVEFIDGADAHERLATELGFAPMLLDENGGYLQTHPLKQRLSAAVVPALAITGTQKLVATACTAYPGAPDFIYVLAAVKTGSIGRRNAMNKVAELAAAMDPAEGSHLTDGITWTARRLAATEEGRLELSFTENLDAAHDVVFAAVPIDGVNSYGWCRWTSLGLICEDEDIA